MRAIVMDDYGPCNILRLANMEAPRVTVGKVGVSVKAAAVNPADVKWRAGMFRDIVPLSFPHVLGYDVAGIVDAVGDDVSGFGIGDRVAGMLDPVTKGGYAEFVLFDESALTRVPPGVSLTVAAAMPTAGLTGVQLIEEHIRPGKGQWVLITGACGAVGRYAVYAALRCGAVVIAGVRESQAALALSLGVSGVVVLGERYWQGEPFDHIADTVGGDQVAALCAHIKPGGLIRTVATTPIDPAGLAEVPQFIAVHPDPARFAQLLLDVEQHRLEVPVAQRLPLHEAARAHSLVEAGGLNGKVLLEP